MDLEVETFQVSHIYIMFADLAERRDFPHSDG